MGGFLAGLEGRRELAAWGLEMVSLSRARATSGLGTRCSGPRRIAVAGGAYLSAGPPRPGGSKAEAVGDLPVGPQ